MRRHLTLSDPVRRYCKFDTFHPAADNGLPVTRVISRVTLQQTLSDTVAKYGGEHVVMNDCHVTEFEEVHTEPRHQNLASTI